MTGTKVLLILLILIVVFFVALIVWGAFGSNASDKTTSSTFEPGSYPVMDNLANLLGSPSPKLKPGELTPIPPPLRRAQPGARVPADKFVLKAGDQPMKFDIAPDSGHQTRRATFSVSREDCAQIEYSSQDGSGGALADQPWPKDSKGTSTKDRHHPTKVTFQIVSARGQLKIAFQQPDCVVEME